MSIPLAVVMTPIEVALVIPTLMGGAKDPKHHAGHGGQAGVNASAEAPSGATLEAVPTMAPVGPRPPPKAISPVRMPIPKGATISAQESPAARRVQGRPPGVIRPASESIPTPSAGLAAPSFPARRPLHLQWRAPKILNSRRRGNV